MIVFPGMFRAAVPSGASTGIYEALELRDKGTSYHGKGGILVKINPWWFSAAGTFCVSSWLRILCIDQNLIQLCTHTHTHVCVLCVTVYVYMGMLRCSCIHECVCGYVLWFRKPYSPPNVLEASTLWKPNLPLGPCAWFSRQLLQ